MNKTLIIADNQHKRLRSSVVRADIADELKMVKRVLSLSPGSWLDLAFYLYKQDNKNTASSITKSDMYKEVPVQKYKYENVDGKRKKVLVSCGTETYMDIYVRKAQRALQNNNNKLGTYIGNKYTDKVIKWSLMYVRKEEAKAQTTKRKVKSAMSKFLNYE